VVVSELGKLTLYRERSCYLGEKKKKSSSRQADPGRGEYERGHYKE